MPVRYALLVVSPNADGKASAGENAGNVVVELLWVACIDPIKIAVPNRKVEHGQFRLRKVVGQNPSNIGTVCQKLPNQ
jgi:hypothetical protein